MKNEITIGRGSRSISVDLPIKGDPEVSRVHAVLSRDNEGRYWLVAKGTESDARERERIDARRANRSRAGSEDRDLQLRSANPAEIDSTQRRKAVADLELTLKSILCCLCAFA